MKTESGECEVFSARETIVTVQWEGSDKDNQARGNGCFWSTRRSTNGEEEEAEEAAWEEVRITGFVFMPARLY